METTRLAKYQSKVEYYTWAVQHGKANPKTLAKYKVQVELHTKAR